MSNMELPFASDSSMRFPLSEIAKVVVLQLFLDQGYRPKAEVFEMAMRAEMPYERATDL